MGDYSFDRFNTRDFEHLIQALARKVFGSATIIFGDGPDGGREAEFEGICAFPDSSESRDGCWVVQAKYKQRDDKEKSFEWVSKEFKAEMDKFIKKKTLGQKLPNNYMFFSNVVLTPKAKTGSRDKIEAFIKKYQTLIPNIKVFGYDDVCRMLDDNRDIATAYASFILPGDILAKLFAQLNKTNTIDDYSGLLARFLEKEFVEDLHSKLEQGGQLTNKKVNLEKVFIDLHATDDGLLPKERTPKFISRSLSLGNSVLKPDTKINNKFVVIGGPGQGKSTLSQYLCQIYRAYFLTKIDIIPEHTEVKYFIESFCIDNVVEPKCYRFPFRIVLKDYATWISECEKKDKPFSIMAYFKERVEQKGNGKIQENEVRKIIRSLSFVFIFDGLDEVPSTSNREEVMSEIKFFLDTEVRRENCDVLIIATTRPHGYTQEFSPAQFKHLYLSDLPATDCLEYINRLLDNVEDSIDQRKQHVDILKRALDNEIASNIMKSPLQATIMVILVLSGGEPPRNRFNLFLDYYKVILSRERQKRVMRILVEHPEYIDAIHHKLGFVLQAFSEGTNNPSSTISLSQFKMIIHAYLFNEMGLSTDDTAKIISEMIKEITQRLVFISEIEIERIGFNIRSIQEFFAANYYLHNQPDYVIPNRLKQIASNSYWRNTFLLGVGYLHTSKSYLISSVESICGELNGSCEDFEHTSGRKIAKIGSWLALDIINEGIFRGKPNDENKFCTYFEELLFLAPAMGHSYFGKISKELQNKWIIPLVNKHIRSENEIEYYCAWTIAIHLAKHGNGEILAVMKDCWPEGIKEIRVLKIGLALGIETIALFINKVQEAIRREDSLEFYGEISQCNSVDFIFPHKLDAQLKAQFLQMLFFSIGSRIVYRKRKSAIGDIWNYVFQKNIDVDTWSPFLFSRGQGLNYMMPYSGEYRLLIESIEKDRTSDKLFFEACKECRIEYLVKLYAFLFEPSKETLLDFAESLQFVSKAIFSKMVALSHNLNWVLVKLFDQYPNADLLPDAINALKNGALGDRDEWKAFEMRIRKNKLIDNEQFELMSLIKRRSWSSKVDFIAFFENYYKNTITNLSPKNKKIIDRDLIQLFIYYAEPWDDDNDNRGEIVKKFLEKEGSIDDILVALDNLEIETNQHYFLNAIIILLVHCKPNDVVKIILKTKEEQWEKISLDSPLTSLCKDFYETCIDRIFPIVCMKEWETPLVKLIFLMYLNGATKTNAHLSHIKHLHDKSFQQESNNLARLLLCLLDDAIDKARLDKLVCDIKEYAMENPLICKYVVDWYDAVKNPQQSFEECFTALYELIAKTHANMSLLSRYEGCIKDICESYPSGFENKAIRESLQLELYCDQSR